MQDTLSPLQAKAQEAFSCFEFAWRIPGDDSSEFVRVRDGSPQWVTDLVHAAHGDMLPDDWRYAAVWGALDCLREADDPEDAAHEWADAFCDVYTSDLLAWVGSHLSRVGYVDQAFVDHELGMSRDGFSLMNVISTGQYDEAREVYDSVWQSLESLL